MTNVNLDLRLASIPPDDPRLRATRAHAGAENVSRAELDARIGFGPSASMDLYPGVYVHCEVYTCMLGGSFVFGVLRGVEGSAQGRIEIHTHRADQIPIVALALDVPEGWFAWRSLLEPDIKRVWQVARRDVRGNAVELERFCEEADARLYGRSWPPGSPAGSSGSSGTAGRPRNGRTTCRSAWTRTMNFFSP